MRTSDRALAAVPAPDSEVGGGRLALRYVARAGLLPELSRQTYDSFYKAVREAVLNALDADATRIDVDFSRVATHGELSVADNGVGMSTRDFCDHFMSVGGSSKFGNAQRFGRIGIGSLALLQYAAAAVIETKAAGTTTATRARIEHAWGLELNERRALLGDVPAGFAEEFEYEGSPADHFTRICLKSVRSDVSAIAQDPAAFYRLIDDLRRVLPLPWKETRLTAALRSVSPSLVEVLEDHTREWSAPVYVHSSWERDIHLQRRSFGEDQGGIEEWSGPPSAILKKVRVNTDEGRRTLVVAGFLLNQKRAHAAWSGITARVQNVAVEEHTFFDVTADPGFRKYISGEVWLLGELDRARLINIDRSSFNRESPDYHAVQRLMSRAIVDFKSSSVQRPQRQKVEIRRRLEAHIRITKAVENVASRVADALPDAPRLRGLPASETRRARFGHRQSILDELSLLGAEAQVDESDDVSRMGYTLDVTADGARVRAAVSPAVAEPTIKANGVEYRLVYAVGRPDQPPVVIRNRPREIIFNTRHPAHETGPRQSKYPLSLALELSYLLSAPGSAESLYDQMIQLMEAL